jgi:hypothetical protein
MRLSKTDQKKEEKMRSKGEAVEEIAKTATTFHVGNAARKAPDSGDDRQLTRVLVEAKSSGSTLHVVNIANEQLGYPINHTDR